MKIVMRRLGASVARVVAVVATIGTVSAFVAAGCGSDKEYAATCNGFCQYVRDCGKKDCPTNDMCTLGVLFARFGCGDQFADYVNCVTHSECGKDVGCVGGTVGDLQNCRDDFCVNNPDKDLCPCLKEMDQNACICKRDPGDPYCKN